ncbi:MAG: hypothetical protein QOJ59_5201, partial [Thermomicrobiales bacterium]|nr:hypothetical protein [Thermomicrobiales bacterium]
SRDEVGELAVATDERPPEGDDAGGETGWDLGTAFDSGRGRVWMDGSCVGVRQGGLQGTRLDRDG